MHELTTSGSGLLGSNVRMSSLEIAQLMNKQHAHVMRDIRKLIEECAIDLSKSGEISYIDQMNREQKMYRLDFEASMVLITGYDAKRRAKVIERWMALERGESTPMVAGVDSAALTAIAGVMEKTLSLVERLQERLDRIERDDSTPSSAGRQPTPDIDEDIQRFVDERCKVGGLKRVDKKRLYEAYRQWCDEEGVLVYHRQLFFKKLYAMPFPVRWARSRVPGLEARSRQILGVALRDEEVQS
jgi:phage regulator Rha-like protein